MFEKYMPLIIPVFFQSRFSVKYCIVFFQLCQYVRVTSFRVMYLISLTKSHTNFFATCYSQKNGISDMVLQNRNKGSDKTF